MPKPTTKTNQTSRPSPEGWPRISSSLFYDDPARAIDWLCDVFGFEVKLKVEGENGRIEHSELSFGPDGLIMVGHSGGRPDRPGVPPHVTPRAIDGGNTQSLCVQIDDVDAHHAHAVASGARITVAPMISDYGEAYWSDKSYGVVDLEGHHWWFVQRLRG